PLVAAGAASAQAAGPSGSQQLKLAGSQPAAILHRIG
ncbi:MAG: hypothetical protein QOG36_1207, partial [Actinomycetota bacterium]|nr:hypothetical protein [Actinomycetota bacterium]